MFAQCREGAAGYGERPGRCGTHGRAEPAHRTGKGYAVDPLQRDRQQGRIGIDGSGKSTTIRLLMGLLRRREGRVRVLGLDPRSDPVEVKRAVGYVAERHDFYPWMRVGELIAFVAHYRSDWDGPYADRRFPAA